MSALTATAKGAEYASNPQRQAIVRSRKNNILQWSKGISASTKNIEVGQTTSLNINFTSPFWEQEEKHYKVYEIYNGHPTESITFMNGPFNHWQNIEIRPNGSNVPIPMKNIATMKEIISELYLNYGLNIFEESSFVRDESTTFNGITVGPLQSKVFYYPLDPLISFAGTCVKDEIKSLQIDFTATDEQANAGKAGLYFKSSGDVNIWTKQYIQIRNINYVRNFVEIRNDAQAVQFLRSLDPKLSVRNVTWKVHEKVIRTGTFNIGDVCNTKLSDIYKANKIQHVSYAFRPKITTYNSPECCKEKSGYKNLGWSMRQLNLGGNEKELDMTDQRRLKDYELRQYRNEYGRKQLPLELFEDANHPMKDYYLRMTRMNFDFMQVENNHEVVRYTNSNIEDYDINIIPFVNLGDGELVAFCVMAEEAEFIRSGPLLGQLVTV